ncbi:nitrate- and nitrite sensing domain-containing protein [Streptomyces sp. NBC_00006]|uniref:sensor histidine kinase n=1 Tax=Streptomyces sp. NBC_00006 TaxID=2975619 RepID=UPI00225B63B3|nr:nitrate- and nitrite sensing domain-containing protein [Streptomyces sp. NBC_00006]MCX5530422.1 nitrate- and nitrite sensing domain-containing protein [Streptomyces sp. NBC_00006]
MSARFPLPERLRSKSIRAKVVTLLTVPVVSVMALWGHAAVTTASQISDKEQLKEVNSALVTPISRFTGAVQDERAAAMKYRVAHDAATRQDFTESTARTDKAVDALNAGLRSISTDLADLDASLPDRIQKLKFSADSLSGPRQKAQARGGAEGIGGYDTAVQRAMSVRAGLAAADSDTARTLLQLARARDALSRQDALLGAAHAADGEMTPGQYREFVGDVAVQRSLTEAALPDLSGRDATAFRAALGTAGAKDLSHVQDMVLAAGARNAVDAVPAGRWQSDARSTLTALDKAGSRAIDEAAGAEPYSLSSLGSSGIAVILGLLGVIVSLLLSVRIGRGLVADLTGLRNAALDMAATRLPASMRRIHNGEDVDLDKEAPLDETPHSDEVGQVGAALTTVQRAALRAVADRAAVLTGVSGVYVSLARRSQVLLHRQLDLLDAMERRTEDPTDLEDLFRIDHLTTRMRRHAESLLILSGSAPGRAWRNPVPLIDAIRAGLAETPDFDRVQLQDIPDLLLAGSAVADVVHLVAELAENASAFSPPHTPVVVRGEPVGAGACLEIEDRGLGMSDEALADANARINASDIDLLDSRKLGLFVVNRLSERQHLDVTLRRSIYGGITAVVFIPQNLLEASHPGLRPVPTPPAAPLPQRTATPPADRPPPRGSAPDPAASRPQSGLELPTRRRQTEGLEMRNPAGPEAQPQAPRLGQSAALGGRVGKAAPRRGAPLTGGVDPGTAEAPVQRTYSQDADLGPAESPVQRTHSQDADPGPAETPVPHAHTQDTGPDGLPRRVRQASISPELRDSAPAQGDGTARSPEAARATMTSLSSGRRRARAAREEGGPAAPNDGGPR